MWGAGASRGDNIRTFLERLRRIPSATNVVKIEDRETTHAVALLDQTDDDLTPLGIEGIQLNVEVHVSHDARITRLTARPTAESLASIATSHAQDLRARNA